MNETRRTTSSRPVRARAGTFRWKGVAIALIAAVAVWFMAGMQNNSLWRDGYTTGYVLIGSLFFLAAFNLRKKLPFLPGIGSASVWMRLHIYVAFFSIAVFAGHVGWHVPNGGFERCLAGLYVLVAGSGIYGLFLTRRVPRLLTATGYEVVFEQIPQRRRQLVQQARSIVLETAQTTDVIARFYVNHVAAFLEQRRSLAYAVAPSMRRSKALVGDLNELDRYLSGSQRDSGRRLAELVREKEDLDFHHAMQGRLKLWLFAHIGMTYGLLVFSVLHGILAHAFGGGLR